MTVTIFTARRGEGKTLWIAKKIEEAMYNSGSKCYVLTDDKGKKIQSYLMDCLHIYPRAVSKRVEYFNDDDIYKMVFPLEHPVYIFIDLPYLTFSEIGNIMKNIPVNSRVFVALDSENI